MRATARVAERLAAVAAVQRSYDLARNVPWMQCNCSTRCNGLHSAAMRTKRCTIGVARGLEERTRMRCSSAVQWSGTLACEAPTAGAGLDAATQYPMGWPVEHVNVTTNVHAGA
jgi:hypothetical protein